MKLDQFEKAINTIENIYKLNDSIDKVFKVEGFCTFTFEIIDSIINILEIHFNDTENKWIDYWIYELDFGKKAKDNSVMLNNVNVPIKTVEDLYNILTSEE